MFDQPNSSQVVNTILLLTFSTFSIVVTHQNHIFTISRMTMASLDELQLSVILQQEKQRLKNKTFTSEQDASEQDAYELALYELKRWVWNLVLNEQMTKRTYKVGTFVVDKIREYKYWYDEQARKFKGIIRWKTPKNKPLHMFTLDEQVYQTDFEPYISIREHASSLFWYHQQLLIQLSDHMVHIYNVMLLRKKEVTPTTDDAEATNIVLRKYNLFQKRFKYFAPSIHDLKVDSTYDLLFGWFLMCTRLDYTVLYPHLCEHITKAFLVLLTSEYGCANQVIPLLTSLASSSYNMHMLEILQPYFEHMFGLETRGYIIDDQSDEDVSTSSSEEDNPSSHTNLHPEQDPEQDPPVRSSYFFF